MIYLHTLGDALIRVGEKDIRPTAPLVFAALLYLGMERGRRVPRAALQELLFPNVDERSGAHSLRQLLYKLRQLGAPLDADSSSVAIQTDRVHDDTAELSFTNGHARSAAKYSLGFLPDYDPKLSDRYDQWLEQRRASVAADIRRELVAAMGSSREAINWPAVEKYAQLILAVDPFNEEATLALAEATALSGAKAEALTILTRYESETGRRDLKLPASLLRRRISDQLPDVRRRAFETPFLGREADAEAVRIEIQRARNGKRALVVIAGEPGIGKTRLLEEAVALARLEGMLVHVVRCQPHHSTRPLGVFIDLVPALLSCRGALGVSPQSLAHLNFLVSHSDDRGDRPTDARDDVTRSSVLLRAIRDLIDAVNAEAPLLLAIEDVHWADADSLRELSSVVGGTAGNSLVVIYTTRVLDTLRQSGAIGDQAVVRRLRPLSEQPTLELARQLLARVDDRDPVEDVSTWCAQTAAGNPLFLQMLCAHYAETGQPFSVPPDLVSAVTRRVEQLPDECRRILELCALLGSHASTEDLRSLSECTQLQLLNAVRRLEEDGYVRVNEEAFTISHDLLSECTLKLVPPVTLRLLHGSVAENLERRYEATRDAALLWDCAEQWTLSGETGKALQFLKRCAQHAIDMGRASQALVLLERARQLARYPSELADIYTEMMLAARAAGQWPKVYEISQEFGRLPRDTFVERHSEQELLSIDACWMVRFEIGDAISRLLGCVAAVEASPSHRLDAASLLLKIAHERGDSELAARAYNSVETLLDKAEPSYSSRMIPLMFHTNFGDSEFAVMIARKVRGDLSSLGSISDQFRAAYNVGTAFSFLGMSEEAIGVYEEFYEKARKLGMIEQQLYLASCASIVNLRTEDFRAAQLWYDRCEVSGKRQSFDSITRTYLVAGSELALWKHDFALARDLIAQLAAVCVGESVRTKAHVNSFSVRLQLKDPQFQCDDAMIEQLFRVVEETREFSCADYLVVALGEALRRRGKCSEAVDMIEDYVRNHRRELSPLPPSLKALLEGCSVAASSD
jgi:DNA-binding SARP family transcriptional activator/tetratricopeptide (TPR) repeat protein